MIVVLTTPRSGSTFMCNRITKECGYKYVGEAFNFEYKKSTSDILNMVNSYRAENNVLLKIFPNLLAKNNYTSKLLKFNNK